MATRRSRRNAEQNAELTRIEQAVLNAPTHTENRGEQLLEDLIDRLGNLELPEARRHDFKPPTYDGEQDIELFITQFRDVARANRWSNEEALLHLRGCLKGPATDCGR